MDRDLTPMLWTSGARCWLVRRRFVVSQWFPNNKIHIAHKMSVDSQTRQTKQRKKECRQKMIVSRYQKSANFGSILSPAFLSETRNYRHRIHSQEIATQSSVMWPWLVFESKAGSCRLLVFHHKAGLVDAEWCSHHLVRQWQLRVKWSVSGNWNQKQSVRRLWPKVSHTIMTERTSRRHVHQIAVNWKREGKRQRDQERHPIARRMNECRY